VGKTKGEMTKYIRGKIKPFDTGHKIKGVLQKKLEDSFDKKYILKDKEKPLEKKWRR